MGAVACGRRSIQQQRTKKGLLVAFKANGTFVSPGLTVPVPSSLQAVTSLPKQDRSSSPGALRHKQ